MYCFEQMKDKFPGSVEMYIGDRFPLKDIASVGAKLLDKKTNSYYTVSKKDKQQFINEKLNNSYIIHTIPYI